MDDESGSPREASPILYVGHHDPRRTTITDETLNGAQTSGYDLMTASMTNEEFQSRVLTQLREHANDLHASPSPATIPPPLISPLLPTDTDHKPGDVNPSVLGIVSPWIDPGSPDPLILNVSRQIFNLEVAYAAFCGINNILVHGPTHGSDVTQFARTIAEGLGLGPYVQIHLLLSTSGELQESETLDSHLSELARVQYLPAPTEDDDEPEEDPNGTWETWNTIRTLCGYSTKLSVALELPRQLLQPSLKSRWYSEPVRALLIPRTSFLRNEKAYPVLSKSVQDFLFELMRLRYVPLVLLGDVEPVPSSNPGKSGRSFEPTPAEAALVTKDNVADALSHLRYMRHFQRSQPSRSPIERFGQGYQDYIQSPLQPLTDNLESITYEVFEKDPVKYEWYERAVASALKDLNKKLGKCRMPVVAVVGAGRGPLVTRVLLASQKTGIKVHCCAVEKNPNAHVVIQRRNATDPLWNGQVKIFKSDMRAWPGPTIGGELQKVDILVSELLGSFADNELSPECLDGVQHVLHPEHGVNIPQSYTAHLTPISTPKLFADLSYRPGDDRWELPYVVMLHQFDFLCRQSSNDSEASMPEVKEAWAFSHPVPKSFLSQSSLRAGGASDGGGWTGGDGKNEHNTRSCFLKFDAVNRGVCHGLAGYFETVLYCGSDGPIELSTNPVTMDAKSKDMISWFPIFFPLKTPLYIPDRAQVEVRMWRQTDDRKVWYEWFVEVYTVVNRVRVKVGVSELHSSRKNGCLM